MSNAILIEQPDGTYGIHLPNTSIQYGTFVHNIDVPIQFSNTYLDTYISPCQRMCLIMTSYLFIIVPITVFIYRIIYSKK